MKKVLFVGDLSPENRTYQWYLTFKQLGYEVLGQSSNSKLKFGLLPRLWHRIKYKFGLPPDINHINEKILSSIDSFKPDLIWILKALMVKPSTLKKAIEINPKIKIASFTEDDMFARHNQSKYYLNCLPLIDFVFTTKSYNCHQDELPSIGARKLIFVDKAYNEQTHRPIDINKEDKLRFGSDVGFIGSFEHDRAQKILYLAKSGVEVRVWGNGWTQYIGRHPNMKIENTAIYKDQFVKSICSTKINLNFLRKINRDLQTSRSIEIPACGGFLLTENTNEHQRLFKENEEAVFFDINKPEELHEKILYYLEHEEERLAIAKAGRERCLKSGYSQRERLSWMLKQVFSE